MKIIRLKDDSGYDQVIDIDKIVSVKGKNNTAYIMTVNGEIKTKISLDEVVKLIKSYETI
ncbi:hypothetical protein [Flavobacterium silvaticum]|uniref:Uncharacterized protein n=1 Tax=Flavobacterium silvaticum TaxID=1852020 RepID=A0A972FIM3_9FLAO|nr:hypothetical protein [Flavobacterium silvaticum]NMH26448.1 hypothetical protein [Flavobacterium silvaticum]